jgi:hypothetical protein
MFLIRLISGCIVGYFIGCIIAGIIMAIRNHTPYEFKKEDGFQGYILLMRELIIRAPIYIGMIVPAVYIIKHHSAYMNFLEKLVTLK